MYSQRVNIAVKKSNENKKALIQYFTYGEQYKSKLYWLIEIGVVDLTKPLSFFIRFDFYCYQYQICSM